MQEQTSRGQEQEQTWFEGNLLVQCLCLVGSTVCFVCCMAF
jgi:hypothetical protein